MGSYQCCTPDSSVSCQLEALSSLLKLVADKSRLRILCVLQRGESCVCEILANVTLSQSLISHHLKDLKDAGLVADRKEGSRVYYALTPQGTHIINLIFQLPL